MTMVESMPLLYQTPPRAEQPRSPRPKEDQPPIRGGSAPDPRSIRGRPKAPCHPPPNQSRHAMPTADLPSNPQFPEKPHAPPQPRFTHLAPQTVTHTFRLFHGERVQERPELRKPHKHGMVGTERRPPLHQKTLAQTDRQLGQAQFPRKQGLVAHPQQQMAQANEPLRLPTHMPRLLAIKIDRRADLPIATGQRQRPNQKRRILVKPIVREPKPMADQPPTVEGETLEGKVERRGRVIQQALPPVGNKWVAKGTRRHGRDEASHPPAHDRHARPSLRGLGQPHQRGRIRITVIGVQKDDPIPSGQPQRAVPRRRRPPIALGHHADTRIPRREGRERHPRPIRGAVIHAQDLDVPQRLRARGGQRPRKRPLRVMRRNNDREPRHHSVHFPHLRPVVF